MGYHRAGFEVVGVDIDPQPNYPFEFHQADALDYPLDGFDAIHASPPCQAYSRAQRIRDNEHPELLDPVRARLVGAGVPYVIENVRGAPLRDPLTLCGTGFGLRFIRHRLFESNVWIMAPGCVHGALERHWHRGRWIRSIAPFGHEFSADLAREVMGIDWMTRDEVSQAIPPAMTEHIGGYLMAALDDDRARGQVTA